ncbi:MAG: hypothetical protein LBH00_13215 [Planctomycetaceae bacterium]|nr:hypothetical protein [Planctomycetaceae bacterium]
MRYSLLILSMFILSGLVGNNPLPAAAPHILSAESDIIFGKGVHAFFDKKYQEAAAILVKAEEIQTPDPRPYYFLGLSYLRLKDRLSAEAYFKKAARLEYENQTVREFEVAESLRRIQGQERERIENYRLEAKLASQRSAARLNEALYGKGTAGKTPPPVSIPAAVPDPLSLPEKKIPAEIGQDIDADIRKNVIKPEPVNPTGQPITDSGETVSSKKPSVFENLPDIPIETVLKEPETASGEMPAEEEKGVAGFSAAGGQPTAKKFFDWRSHFSAEEETSKQIGKGFGKTLRPFLLKQKGNSATAEEPSDAVPADVPAKEPVTAPGDPDTETGGSAASETVPESVPEKETDQ